MRFTACLIYLAAALPVSAQLPAEGDRAYHSRILLLYRPNPLFGEDFRRNLRSDLKADLEGRLGSLVQWEVAEKPAEAEVPLLQVGPTALDNSLPLGDEKLHVAWIESTERGIRVRSRQRDGATGILSPLREETLPERAGLLKQIAAGILRDFGFTGTFAPAGDSAMVSWRAGLKGNALADWVRPGDVLKVVQIRRETATSQRGSTADCDDVLLQVSGEMAAGQSACKLYRQYAGELPAPRGAILGYRCIRLATETAPLRLKLVDPRGQPLRQGVQVRMRDAGFAENASERDLAQLRDGLFSSRDPLAHLAFVRVDIGDRSVARFPLAITGDGVVTRTVSIEPGAEARDRLLAQRTDWLRRAGDSRLVQAVCFRDMIGLEKQGKMPQALELARRTLDRIDADAVQLRADLAKLNAQYAEAKAPIAGFANALDEKLLGLGDSRRQLDDHIRKLDEVVRQEAAPEIVKRRKEIAAVTARIDANVQQADIPEALKLYDEAIALAGEEKLAREELAKKRDELRAKWEPKGEAHATARTFVYDTWAKTATFYEMKDRLPVAKQAFETFKTAGDRYGIAKLNRLEPDLETRLAEEIQKVVEGPKTGAALAKFDSMTAFKTELIAFHKAVAEALRAMR